MRVKCVFRPSVQTSWGTFRDIDGEYDLATGVLWVVVEARPGIEGGKRGVHLSTRTEIIPLIEPAPEVKQAPVQGGRNNQVPRHP